LPLSGNHFSFPDGPVKGKAADHGTWGNVVMDYLKKGIPRDRIMNTVVGDLQRIKFYPAKGFQVYLEIPHRVEDAFEELVAYGFDRRLATDGRGLRLPLLLAACARQEGYSSS
jgi:hypothetical protein